MTKEYILDKRVKYAWECDQFSTVIPYSDAANAMDEYAGSLISSTHSITTILQVPKHILDEYAKRQCVEFIKWAVENNQIKPDGFGYVFIPGDEALIYSEFIEQQNKGNDR